MNLYYEKTRYVVDNTLAIMTWTDEDGYLEPYGDVTVNLSAYGMFPQGDGYIFMPTYKMTTDYYKQVCEDIVEEVIQEVPIGYGRGVYAKLKDDWESHVTMIDEFSREDWTEDEEMMACAVCGKEVKRESLLLTYDCHGIPFRYVCDDCYSVVMRDKGYDGEYYTEADECIDWDY